MSIAFWCVLVAGYLPIAFAGAARWNRKFDNSAPRNYLDQATGWRKRAHWAQLNGFEAFPPFAAAVIIASLSHVSQNRIDLLAASFVALRVIYGLLYIANKATLRSAAWIAATTCVVGLFVSAAFVH